VSLALLLLGALDPATIVVFPVEAVAASPALAEEATRRVGAALEKTPGNRVLGPEAVRAKLGLDLGAQAAACASDVLCLVQIGEVLEAARLVTGQLKGESDGRHVLRLSIIDVASAALADSERFEAPAREGAVLAAIDVAARQMFSEPDATVIFDVYPEDARFELFGVAPTRPRGGTPTPFWSGVYFGRAVRTGYHPLDVKITVAPGGPARIRVELEPDPLWVDPDRAAREAQLGDRPYTPRPPPPPAPSAFANWWAWATVAAGAAAGATGAFLMTDAQGGYNDLAAEQRFTLDRTQTSFAAIDAREAARDEYALGRTVGLAGAGVAAVGLTWMIIDALVSGPPRPTRGANE